MDVAIVGIDIHPFARTAERSGMQQRTYAAPGISAVTVLQR